MNVHLKLTKNKKKADRGGERVRNWEGKRG